jgi:hypothetical protein
MCLFGPPQELLSDQGREFVNATVTALSAHLGTHRRLTSPYHPRTDGLVERFNQSLIDSLEKQCQEHPEDWDLYLDSVLFAYRVRVHSATGFSPFELLYGRPANLHTSFVDSPLSASLSVPDSLSQRADEIQSLNDVLWPTTVDRIREVQIEYRRQQNARVSAAAAVSDTLSPGRVVYVRILQPRRKLHPRFLGPYKVSVVTENGNYLLANKKNQVLRRAYPLNQLKLVPSDVAQEVWTSHCTDNEFPIDRVVDTTMENGHRLYLVHWRGLDNEHDSWHNEGDIRDPDMIALYWSSKGVAPTDPPAAEE